LSSIRTMPCQSVRTFGDHHSNDPCQQPNMDQPLLQYMNRSNVTACMRKIILPKLSQAISLTHLAAKREREEELSDF
jgi:hypothetical protein